MTQTFRLVRSKRKTISLEITRELEILVRAPLRAPQSYIEDFVASKAGWIEAHLPIMEARLKSHPEPSTQEAAALQKAARAIIPRRVTHFAALMGLTPAGITITGAKTRFGSCSGKNRLSFSWRLMAYPPEAVDYVVVHELAHIRHKNHGGDFYALVEATLPDYKSRRKLLK